MTFAANYRDGKREIEVELNSDGEICEALFATDERR
jgi:hypothetical protein